MDGKKEKLLSSLIVNMQQRLILVIDETGKEKCAERTLRRFLVEQGQEELKIRTLPLSKELKDVSYLSNFLSECRAQGKKQKPINIVLPTLADLLCYMQPTMIFELLHELRNCAGVQCSLIWASIPHLMYSKLNYLLAACEYVCDTVVHLLDKQNLNVITRKPGGSISSKTYTYKVSKNEFLVTMAPAEEKKDETNTTTSHPNAQSSTDFNNTFKIELEEEELVARNAMKLPYEKTTETVSGGGNIVYMPDASDDFDEEDPDEDLCI